MAFVLVILWPIAEIVAAIEVARLVGVLLCVLLLLAGWPVGGWLLRSEGRNALRRFGAAVAAGRAPAVEAAEGALVLFGGALLIIPGFITDAIGLLGLVPVVRRRLAALLVRHARGRTVSRAMRFGARRAYDVDATAHDVTPPGRGGDPSGRPGLPG